MYHYCRLADSAAWYLLGAGRERIRPWQRKLESTSCEEGVRSFTLSTVELPDGRMCVPLLE